MFILLYWTCCVLITVILWFPEKWSNEVANHDINVYICFQFCQFLLHVFELLLLITPLFTIVRFSRWVLCAVMKCFRACLLISLALNSTLSDASVVTTAFLWLMLCHSLPSSNSVFLCDSLWLDLDFFLSTECNFFKSPCSNLDISWC